MTSESIDAVSRVTWVVIAFVVVHDALFSESVVAAVAPEAADGILTLSVGVGAGCVTLVHIPLTVRTLPSYKYFHTCIIFNKYFLKSFQKFAEV